MQDILEGYCIDIDCGQAEEDCECEKDPEELEETDGPDDLASFPFI